MLKRNIIVVFFVSFLTIQNVNAIEIEKESILDGSYFIQVGAYKNNSSVKNTKNRLLEYDLYLEPYKGLHRIYIVNILSKNQLVETLKEVRKIYQKAFVAKSPKLIKDISIQEAEQIPVTIQNFEQVELKLDSNTILSTRKSF